MKKKESIRDLVKTIYTAAWDTKAMDMIILDLKKVASFADYLVLCSGTSQRQVGAIADHIKTAVKKKFVRNPLSIEGVEQSSWILIDYGDVVCHVFTEEARQFYSLDDLWHDA